MKFIVSQYLRCKLYEVGYLAMLSVMRKDVIQISKL